jgi:hypothetical protein
MHGAHTHTIDNPPNDEAFAVADASRSLAMSLPLSSSASVISENARFAPVLRADAALASSRLEDRNEKRELVGIMSMIHVAS